MNKSASPQRDEVVRVRVPFSIRKRGGRKLFVMPTGAEAVLERPRVDNAMDNAMDKALARAFRWRKLLETGVHGTIEELAAAERITINFAGVFLDVTNLSRRG